MNVAGRVEWRRRQQRPVSGRYEVFNIGDRVFHPAHGAGTIIAIEERNILNEANRYYILDLVGQNGMIVMVPVADARRMCLRQVIEEAAIPRVFEVLNSRPNVLSNDYSERQERIAEILKTSDTIKIAEVVRDLTWHGHLQHLTQVDKRLHERAQNLLGGELALTEGIELDKAKAQVQDALARRLKASREAESESRREYHHHAQD